MNAAITAEPIDICSVELGCKMNFGIYLPPKAESTKVPVIYWLSGENTDYFIVCYENNV